MGYGLWSLLRNGQGGKWLSGFSRPRVSLFCFTQIRHTVALPLPGELQSLHPVSTAQPLHKSETVCKFLTFVFLSGPHVFCYPLDGANESIEVRAVDFTAHKVFQFSGPFTRLSAKPGLQVVNFSFKCLWGHGKGEQNH